MTYYINIYVSLLPENGNTTYYEYLYGEKPSKIEETIIMFEDDLKVYFFIYNTSEEHCFNYHFIGYNC